MSRSRLLGWAASAGVVRARRSRFESLEFRRLLAFFSAPQFAVGDFPLGAACADFNGDGLPDAAVSNAGTNNVSILLGVGNGAFTAASNFAAGAGPDGIAVGDFNSDTIADLVVINGNASDLSILLGAGDGSFGEPTNYPCGSTPHSVIVADLNNDGSQDLAVTNHTSDAITVLLNSHDAFAIATTYAIATQPYSIGPADFDGDGYIDLAVVGQSGDNVTLMINRGNGAFRKTGTFAVGSTPSSAAVGDFNNDGEPDLAVASLVDNSVSVLLHAQDTVFAPAVAYAVDPFPCTVVAGDFDGDGETDLATNNYAGNSVSLLKNVNGSFAAAVTTPAGTAPWGLAAADFNNDGHPDLMEVMRESDVVTVLINHGGGAFDKAGVAYAAADSPTRSVVGDFNGDGFADIATTLNGTTPDASVGVTGVSVRLNDGSGGFGSAVRYAAGLAPTGIATADFTGDGILDLVVTNRPRASNPGTGTFSLLIGSGGGVFGPPLAFASNDKPEAIVGVDFNNDGKIDVAVVTSGSLWVYRGFGDGTFTTLGAPYAAGSGARDLIAVDFNGDGKLDLATANSDTALGNGTTGHSVSVFLGVGNGTFNPPVRYQINSPWRIASGDVNGDGKPDIIASLQNVISNVNGIGVLLNIGNGAFGSAILSHSPRLVAGIAAGDFNGDGRLDVATAGLNSSGTTLLYGNGTGAFAGDLNYGVGDEPVDINVADFNHDGRSDLAVASATGNSVTVLLNQDVDAIAPTRLSATQNIDGPSVTFNFSLPMSAASIDPRDLQISNLTTEQTTTNAVGATLSPDGKSITFTLPTTLANGNYRFRLTAGAVSSARGAITTANADLAGPSIFVLAGDADHNKAVDFNDLVKLAQNYGQLAKTFSQGNVNYSADGAVDFADLVLLAQQYNASLPLSALPVSVATTLGDRSLGGKRKSKDSVAAILAWENGGPRADVGRRRGR